MIGTESNYNMICGMCNKTKDECGRAWLIIGIVLNDFSGLKDFEQIISRYITFKHTHTGMVRNQDCIFPDQSCYTCYVLHSNHAEDFSLLFSFSQIYNLFLLFISLTLFPPSHINPHNRKPGTPRTTPSPQTPPHTRTPTIADNRSRNVSMLSLSAGRISF